MSPSGTTTAPLPPLPAMQPGGQAPAPDNPMAALMSGVAPVKSAVDQILMACKQIVQSGTVPGAEQPCGQIVALATSLLPMAVQQMMQPGGQGGTPTGGIGPVGAGAPSPLG